jgi:nitrite reductase (NO-forming)
VTQHRLMFAAAAAVAAAASIPAAAAPPVYPARVQVAADEFRFTLSRLKITAGPAIIELANFGEDPHDLRFRRAGGTRTYAIAETAPGADRDLEVRLLPGKFTLWCSIADHRQRGMQITLLVVKR